MTVECPTMETLSALLDGTAADLETLESHIRDCSNCQTRLDGLSESTVLREARATTHANSLSYSFLGAPHAPGDLGSIDQLRIRSEIGRGGMGVVFEGVDESLGRSVAVKVLSTTPNQAANSRFAREAKTAASLQDDHLVTVFSIGHTIDHRPYLVMPLVRGEPLKRRLSRGVLNTSDAATFTMQVAQGLAAMHQVGLVHRDVKPGNILIDEQDGRAKLTDFGLARSAIDATLTQANAICGTPQYLSPEQAHADNEARAASDIYSLGITLYECLTGTTPFRGAPLEILRQHQEATPTPLKELNASVPRDLETICLKAIAKEPHRRYASATDFADDLRRFLDGRPIQAKPTTTWAMLWLWSKRNRGLAISIVSLLVALVAGITASTALWIRSERNAAAERAASENAAKRLVQLEKGNAILGSIFADLDVQGIRSDGKSLESVLGDRLVAAAGELDSQSVGDPLVEAELQHQLGVSLSNLGFPNQAIELLTKALATRKERLGNEHADTLTTMMSLVAAYQDDHQIENSKPLCFDALALSETLCGADGLTTATAMSNLAFAYNEGAEYQEARPLYERALEIRSQQLGAEDPATLNALDSLAGHLDDSGNPAEALPLFQQALQGNLEIAGADHPRTAMAMNNLAFCHKRLSHVDKAVDLFQRALEIFKSRLPADHPDVLMCSENLAFAYLAAGDYELAIPKLEELVDQNTAKLGRDHFQTLVSMDGLASGYRLAGRSDDAVQIWEQVLTRRKSALGESHPVTLTAMNNLATGYYSIGALEKAADIFQQCYQGSVANRGADNVDTTYSASNLAAVYFKLGKFEKALPLNRKSLAVRRQAFGDDHPDTLLSMANLANNLRDLEELTEAIELYEEALIRLKTNLGEDHPQTLRTLLGFAIAQQAAGNTAGATETLSSAKANTQNKLGADHPLLQQLNELLEEYQTTKKGAEAAP